MFLPSNQLRQDTKIFIGISFVLSLIGLLFIYSASSVYALEKFGSEHYFFKRQLIYLCIAVLSFIGMAKLPLSLIKKSTPYLFFGFFGLTALTVFPWLGVRMHGSSRWLSVVGLSVQPSEFLKLFLFMYIGLFLERKHGRLNSFFHGYLPFTLILGSTFFLLLKQPDFGSVATIFITIMMVLFVTEFSMKHLFVVALLAMPAALLLIATKAYRLNRILVFLNPWSDPQGRGFQIIQSLIAIGSGNIWGLGIAGSRQKFFYLPMQHTDFIFPIIAEETGFIGSMLLLVCYVAFLIYGFRIVLCLQERFVFFTCMAFILFISLQAMLNIMVTVGLIPTKGMGLPFVSYGGSSLLSLFCMLGFIVNSVKNN